MICEFGLTPGVFLQNKNSPGLFALQDMLKTIIRENHIIGVVRRKSWNPAVSQAIDSLESPFRENLSKLLSVLKDRGRFIPRQYQPNPESNPKTDVDWLNEFLLAHRENPFDAIVTLLTSRETCARAADFVYSVEAFVESHILANYQCSRRVKREASEFVKVLGSILLYSRSILLIDPHIDTTYQRYKRPLSALINAAFDRGRYSAPSLFEIHLKAKDDTSAQETAMKNDLLPLLKRGAKARVVLWGEKETQEVFHNRFILTDLCGIEVGKGLDEPKHGGLDHDDWCVMAENHRQVIWSQFRGSTTFDQKHEFYLVS
jgi:hypothetical protein